MSDFQQRQETDDGVSFSGGALTTVAIDTGETDSFGRLQLLNPTGSDVIVYVDSMVLGGGSDNDLDVLLSIEGPLSLEGGAPSPLLGTAKNGSKKSIAQIRQREEVLADIGTIITSFDLSGAYLLSQLANTVERFDNPYRLGPGQGLTLTYFVHNAFGGTPSDFSDLCATWQWREFPS